MNPRVALVTTADAAAVHDDLDRPFLDAAFARAGLSCALCAWEDEGVDWNSFDLVVVRSPWNYVENEAAFRSFLAPFRVSPDFANPVAVIEWNIDKRYLRELAERGIPIVPTRFVERVSEIDDALAATGGSEFVVKPTVSAGSRLTGRFVPGDAQAAVLARAILDDGRAVMVQPYLSSVDDEGEYAVISIDGRFAHRARKAQILEVGGTFLGGGYREVITPATVDPVLEAVARSAADACRDVARERGWMGPADELLYARYDIARTSDGGAVLLEAELFEPALFLPSGPATADLFAAAVARRIHGVE